MDHLFFYIIDTHTYLCEAIKASLVGFCVTLTEDLFVGN